MHLTEDEFELALWSFGEKTVLRGINIFEDGAVEDLDVQSVSNGVVLTASVIGSRTTPYRTIVKLTHDRDTNLVVVSSCTCPVGDMCKHGAAVFLEWQEISSDDELVIASAPELLPDVIQPATLTSSIEQWLAQLQLREASDAAPKKPRAATAEKFVGYHITPGYGDTWGVTAQRATMDSRYRGVQWSSLNSNGLDPDRAPAYVEDCDIDIGTKWPDVLTRAHYRGADLTPGTGDDLLRTIMATGRAYLGGHSQKPLTWAVDEAVSFQWFPRFVDRPNSDLVLKLAIGSKPVEHLIRLQDWYWIDPRNHQIGKAVLPISVKRASLLLSAPPVPTTSIDLLADALPDGIREIVAPLPVTRLVERIDVTPIPVLEVKKLSLRIEDHALQPFGQKTWKRSVKLINHNLPVACIWFDYAGHRFGYQDDGKDLIAPGTKSIKRVVRNPALEAKLAKAMEPAKLTPLMLLHGVKHSQGEAQFLAAAPHNVDSHFQSIILAILPSLINQGWRFESTADLGLSILRPEDGYTDIGLKLKPKDDQEAGKIDWFDLHIGTRIDGQEVDLAPAIMAWLKTLKPGARVERIEALLQLEASGGEAILPLSDGRLVALDSARLRPILEALLKLFSPRELSEGDIGLSGQRLAELAEIDGVAHLAKDWANGSKGAQLAQALANWRDRPEILLPASFKATLRPYQQEGLEWLNMLFQAGMGACLADDMGLGKTVQTLAHIAVLKASGDLSGPILIVAPTSVVPNWLHEIARFTPELKALNFTGIDRLERVDDLATSDIILSSYALLNRDEAILGAQTFAIIVLDEAQNIRNAATNAAKAAFSFKAQQKIALSGTPVENHLGDLWSMMRFLNPGLLGDSKQFQADFRKPIEKANESDAKTRLSRRIKPFFLRRTKEQVATDLPDRTELTHDIELTSAQRDLYEVTRAAMQTRVVEAMSAKGLAQSAIVILDALLKLRQCCCDPRLVKTATKAAKAGGSAKLAQLMEMLEELLAEGRRVLVFSQFTTMLDLIEDEFKGKAMSYERLDGSTRDRDGPVSRFQAGDSDIFLISTKAGGVGLNLTAADTVILYDPWWNPAVEAQAIGRAHRIGQQRPVFVHRLICRDTIEEKMLALQAKKQALAGVLWMSDDPAEGGESTTKSLSGLSEADVLALFG